MAPSSDQTREQGMSAVREMGVGGVLSARSVLEAGWAPPPSFCRKVKNAAAADTRCRAPCQGQLHRRSAVRNVKRAGVSRSVAMKMTGHKIESLCRRYAIVSDSDLREAGRKLTASRTVSDNLGVVSPNLKITQAAKR